MSNSTTSTSTSTSSSTSSNRSNAAAGAPPASANEDRPSRDGAPAFDEFYCEVKEIEKRDSVLTSEQQINRLLRPGSTYFNLNPFEVLQLEPTVEPDHIKKKYRSLSMLVHPDKNRDNVDKAQQAFEVVNKAYKVLCNEVTRKKCLDVYEEAKDRTDHMIGEKRKKLKKEGKGDEPIREDDPESYKHAVYVMVMKLFADMERRRQQLDTRDMEERKRLREAEIEEEERRRADKEWQKNFEESRQNRVTSWHSFQSGGAKSAAAATGSSTASASTSPAADAGAGAASASAPFNPAVTAKKPKKAKKMSMFNPPKLKPETR